VPVLRFKFILYKFWPFLSNLYCSFFIHFCGLLHFLNVRCYTKSHNSSVSIALGYRLNDQCSRVRFPAGAGNFSLHHCIQNGSGAHLASHPMGTRGSFLWGKAARVWSWPLTSIYCWGQRMNGAIPLFLQYAFMAWCSVKAQGQLYLYLYLIVTLYPNITSHTVILTLRTEYVLSGKL
jgi:hypothetical protein